jgi:glycosyltransferase involved in cell wall biosynthesis
MLLYKYQENWIGGTYYILNIIKALNLLSDEEKPYLTILHSQQSITDIRKIKYPYIDFVSFNFSMPFAKRMLNKLSSLLKLKLIFTHNLPGTIENLYPFTDTISQKNIKHVFAWIPDFQEQHLPEYFSKLEVVGRKRYHKRIIRLQIPIVFSSETSLGDFDNFYPNSPNKKFVIQFSSLIDKDYQNLDINELKRKFNITHPYFIVANQLWKHKNHLCAIKAFEILIQKYPDVQLVCTGKEHDHRNPTYPKEIKRYIEENELAERILFIGFIDRNEQLKLMKESLAIVQPSLFEGWSTVVEDAKALNHFILLSDIRVHREQINLNCQFFDPTDVYSLANKMKMILIDKPEPLPYDHSASVKEFARKFISMLE